MSKYAGAVRTHGGLEIAKKELEAIGSVLDEALLDEPYEFKIYNMYMNASAIVSGAIARKESVGAHYIVD